MSSLKEKINEHSGVFSLGFFTLGLAFNPAFNRYQSEKLKTFRLRKIPNPLPSTDTSEAMPHHFMTFEEWQVNVSEWITWITGTGPNIFSFMISDCDDAFYDDLNQCWDDLCLTVRSGQHRFIFIHQKGATYDLYEFNEFYMREPGATAF